MKKRITDSLKEFGYQGTIEDFRTALIEIKAEHFGDWSIDELTYTRDEAAEFCQLVKKRLSAPRMTRPFILRSLVGIRKNKPRPKPQTA
jgi:lipoate-protein ligase A